MTVCRVLGAGPWHADVAAVRETILEELDVGIELVVNDRSGERGLRRCVDVTAPAGPPA